MDEQTDGWMDGGNPLVLAGENSSSLHIPLSCKNIKTVDLLFLYGSERLLKC